MVQFTRYIIALSIPAFSHGCAVHGSPPCNDYLSSVAIFEVTVDDVPGSLHTITGVIASHRGNVITVAPPPLSGVTGRKDEDCVYGRDAHQGIPGRDAGGH
jgi:hypothetical protein